MFARGNVLRQIFGSRKRVFVAVIGAVFVILVIAIVSAADSGSSEDEEKPASSQPRATATATIPQTVLQEFVLCGELEAKMTMLWGQAPNIDLIYSENPDVSGQLEVGDRVRILTPRPDPAGLVRVRVSPHDGRLVGKTSNQVWIDWKGLERNNLERVMFECAN